MTVDISGLEFCNCCVLQGSCTKMCKRMSTLISLVSNNEKLEEAYNTACAELVLGSHYYMGYNLEEVKQKFLQK